jgi:demethylmenaquinone methyltransferase/2-methoxy-6-polyprenyl-1,4-benzoquinol methylase
MAEMFDYIVPVYDRINRIMSLGRDGRWRRLAADAAELRGGRALDLGCGTGRLGLLLSDRASVVGVDVSAGMLREARRVSGERLLLVSASAFELPFGPATFDAVVSGFVLRNLEDLRAAFVECARVLASGGRISLVDATEPGNAAWRAALGGYLRFVPPALGALAGRAGAYGYLLRSLAHLPPPGEVAALLENCGFAAVRIDRYSGGSVTLWRGLRR